MDKILTDKNMEKIIFSTNTQKTLKFLITTGRKRFERAEIEKKTGLSKAGVNLALKELTAEKLIKKAIQGRSYIYEVDYSNPAVKSLKTLKTISALLPVIEKLKLHSQKIILFGSSSRGEDTPESDIDIFIMTRENEAVRKIISTDKLRRKMQPVIKTPFEFSDMEKKEPYFYKEVDRGIILFDAL